MGKVKKIRQKYHLSLKKSKSLSNLSEAGEQKSEAQSKQNSLVSSKDNIFSGIDISWDDINKQLPQDFDVRSMVSNRSRRQLKEEDRHLKKKEKKKLRHERFLHKLDVTHQILKASKTKKKKQVKSKDSGMTSLLDALPSLQSPVSSSNSNRKYENRKIKPKGILKVKDRLKQQALDTKIFKHILDDKTFKENPLQAVSQYLKQRVAMDA